MQSKGGWPTILALVLLGVLLLAPGSAKANKEQGGGESPPKEKKDGAKTPHPPEDKKTPIDPKLDLTIWTIVVFGLLFVVLRYVKLPGAPKPAFVMMMEGLQRREESIQAALDDAKKASEDARRLREELQQERNKVQEEVRGILEEARKDAQHVKDQMISEGRTEIDAERQRALREVEISRDQAMQHIWTQAAQLATLISSKAISKHLTQEDHRQLVDEALTELRSAKTPQGS